MSWSTMYIYMHMHNYVLGESSRKRPIEVVPEQPVKQAAPQTGKE